MIAFSRQQRQLGQGMTEYIIIVALIAVAAIGVYSYFGATIRAQMAGMTNELAGKSGGKDMEKAATAAKDATTANVKKDLSNFNEKNIAK
jgi:type IV pilus assembly protein PilA